MNQYIRRLCLLAAVNFIAGLQMASAQPMIDRHWIFGYKAGLDFSAATPTSFLVPDDGDYGFRAYEGCASISNMDGDLLFYTNGQGVWDRNFNVMPGGTNILPEGVFVGSTTQATVIVPLPGSDSRYYIFSLEEYGMPGRLYYTLVDMSLNGGLGDVVAGEKGIYLDEGFTEKMTVVPGKCRQAWVIVRSKLVNEYKAFAITEAGLDTDPVISPVGSGPLNSYISGTLKCSNDGKRIAATLYPRAPENIAGIELYDFDAATGTLSAPAMLKERVAPPGEGGYYGLCFSPDDTKLYAGNHFPNTISQFDVSLPDMDEMTASETIITDMGTVIPGDMRTGPDGKLYIAAFEKPYLNRINSPDIAGVACDFVNNAVLLPYGTFCNIGLPNRNIVAATAAIYDTVTSYTHRIACSEADISSPSEDATYLWNTGETTRSIRVTEPGVYTVMSRTACAIMIDSFEVTFVGLPVSLLGDDTVICIGSNINLSVLPAVPDDFLFSWNTGGAGRTINASAPGIYSVTASLPPCIITDSMQVLHKDCDCYLEMPTVFSPNGDGINDILLPVGTPGCSAIENYSLNIYNRWGQRIFNSSAMTKGWDGYQYGRLVEMGVYFYTLSYVDRYNKLQNRKGDVAVVR